MHVIKNILTYFFVTLGVIFFCILCTGAYLWFADPYGIRPFLSGTLSTQAVPLKNAPSTGDQSAIRTSTTEQGMRTETSGESTPNDKHPGLDSNQEALLEKAGIDPATLPTQLTPVMEVCFTETLGSARVAEIKGGATPTPLEFISARSCLAAQ